MDAASRCVSILIALLLTGLAGVSAAESPSGQARPPRRAAAYAEIEVGGVVSDARPPVYLVETKADTLYELVGRIERARRDASVRGVLLRVHEFEAGFAKVQELRRALSACREAGKPVVCVLESADNLSYYLATGADRIVLAPATSLMLVGVRAEVVFARGLLDKIGVQAEIVQAGRYKSAGEGLTRKEPSHAFRESLESLVDDYFDQLIAGIAQGRGTSRSAATALVRHGPYTAGQARTEGLVDDVLFYDELVAELEGQGEDRAALLREYGRSRRAGAQLPGPGGLLSLLMGGGPPARAAAAGPAVAVLHAVGPIVSGRADDLGFGDPVVAAEDFAEVIREVAQDDNVKAIVLRIESPGGSAQACDSLWRELRLADARKPVVASLSDMAASGGYYLAAGGRRICAEPGALTGSIGVIGGKLVLSDLMEKLGLNVFVIERGGATGLASSFSPLSPQERGKLRELIADAYSTFLARVAETRPGMSAAQVDDVAQGRVWTGRQAAANGLVDELGGLAAAIEAARQAAGLPADQRVRVVHLPRARSLMEMVLFSGSEAEARLQGAGSLTTASLAVQVAAAVVPPGFWGYATALSCLGDEPALCVLPGLVRVR